MRIAVIGAGIVGVATAYELAADGHEVVVFDRRSGVAAEASFAHIGFVTQCITTPWSMPSARPAMLRQLLQGRGALRHWRWLAHWWRSSGAGQAPQRRALCALQRLSQQRLAELRNRLPLAYERHDGILMPVRTESEMAGQRRNADAWRELGIQVREIDAATCQSLEPDLHAAGSLAGVLHLHADETGNCRQVAHLLREAGEARHGVEFRFGLHVTRVVPDGQRPRVQTGLAAAPHEFATTTGAAGRPAANAAGAPAAADAAAGRAEEAFDTVVIAAGVESAGLLRPLRLELPLLPVYGYSATFALRVKEIGPRGALFDPRHDVAIARTGTRVRVAGGAELGGDPARMRQATLVQLHKSLQDWFPGSVHMTQPQVWKGVRPTLPDGLPLVGPTNTAGVWVNLGHGHGGWALACGSARLLADQISRRTPEVDPQPFQVSRLRA